MCDTLSHFNKKQVAKAETVKLMPLISGMKKKQKLIRILLYEREDKYSVTIVTLIKQNTKLDSLLTVFSSHAFLHPLVTLKSTKKKEIVIYIRFIEI